MGKLKSLGSKLLAGQMCIRDRAKNILSGRAVRYTIGAYVYFFMLLIYFPKSSPSQSRSSM